MIAFALIMCSLSVIGAVGALLWLFVASQQGDIAESNADRAYRWREQMREISHNRN